jgi:DNA-binding LacI/PurR family transcriptional regulator
MAKPIAVICYWLHESPLYRTVYDNIRQEAAAAGREILLHAPESEVAQHETVQPYQQMGPAVDGFIDLDSTPARYIHLEKFLKDLAQPVVMVNHERVTNELDSIVFDSYANTRRMMQFLINLGHTRIGLVNYKTPMHSQHESASCFNLRTLAYCDALRENELPLVTDLTVSTPSSRHLNPYLTDFFSRPDLPSALFCVSDILALAVCTMAAFYKKRVPEDLTVVGYDGIPEGRRAKPPLTTVDNPLEEMGRQGVKRLMEKIKDRAAGIKDQPRKILLPGRIFEGGTHRQINQGT